MACDVCGARDKEVHLVRDGLRTETFGHICEKCDWEFEKMRTRWRETQARWRARKVRAFLKDKQEGRHKPLFMRVLGLIIQKIGR